MLVFNHLNRYFLYYLPGRRARGAKFTVVNRYLRGPGGLAALQLFKKHHLLASLGGFY